jgi:hypothetical protein
MDFAHSAAARDTIERMTAFMNEHVIPAEKPISSNSSVVKTGPSGTSRR